eukprot:NODE_8152_length_1518_cov_9.105679.p1 GENE.NODE_8152_length_1518_cov_9.105679~~NODE_8152_length_1518_cov_9.105679.p1  ORF type:complete len:389 (-),score=96.37 NODE_8152_length_1518_cov_9.105679:226-1392(-)
MATNGVGGPLRNSASVGDSDECRRLRAATAELELQVTCALRKDASRGKGGTRGAGARAGEECNWLERASELHAELVAKQDLDITRAELAQRALASEHACTMWRRRTAALRSDAAICRETLSQQIADFDEQRAQLEERAGELSERSLKVVGRFQAKIKGLLQDTDALRSEVRRSIYAASERSSRSTAAPLGNAHPPMEDAGTSDDWEDDWGTPRGRRPANTRAGAHAAVPGLPLPLRSDGSLPRSAVGHNSSSRIGNAGGATPHSRLAPTVVAPALDMEMGGAVPAAAAASSTTSLASAAIVALPQQHAQQRPLLSGALRLDPSIHATQELMISPGAECGNVAMVPTLVQAMMPVMPVGPPQLVMLPAPKQAGCARYANTLSLGAKVQT